MDKALCSLEAQVTKIKTSISIDKDLWRKFSLIVLQKEGNRKLSDIIKTLIEHYIKKNDGMKK